MKYTIQKLDGRHTYHKLFDYYIGFSSIMPGPMDFSSCQQWFFKTYGWSAEVRTYHKIFDYFYKKGQYHSYLTKNMIKQEQVPADCNPHWSWTSNTEYNYRIYIAGEEELSFFCLAHPIDQK